MMCVCVETKRKREREEGREKEAQDRARFPRTIYTYSIQFRILYAFRDR